MANKHEIYELKQMQSLPLEGKLSMTIARIRAWLDYFNDECYIAFSGGKDSTVLVDIVHNKMGRDDIPLVFADTGLEYPEIREFVKGYGDKVTWIKPKMTFRQVIEKYGYPMISKEVSESVHNARKYLSALAQDSPSESKIVGYWGFADLMGIERRKKDAKEDYQNLKKGIIPDGIENMPIRVQSLFGRVQHKEKGKLTNEYSQRYDKSKYRFFLDAPFEIDNSCCKVMKKTPMHTYSKNTGKKPITAQMADESRLRQQQWLKNGCNGFEMKMPISNPMSFWTEQDVLEYIKKYNIPIAKPYGKVTEDTETTGMLEGQMNLNFFDEDFHVDCPLKTTGCQRTGCVFCGYGATVDTERYLKIEEFSSYALRDFCMRGGAFAKDGLWKPDNRGLGMWFVIKWINIHGGFKTIIPEEERYEKEYGNELTKYYLYEMYKE